MSEIPNMPAYIPHSELPESYIRKGNQKHREALKRFPRWTRDARILDRISNVYQDYTRRMTLPELTEKYGISVTQIYKDISRARELMIMMTTTHMVDALDEQIEVRRAHVRQLQQQLAMVEQQQEDGELRSANALASIARLHDSISKHESAIEGLLGVKADRTAVKNTTKTRSTAEVTAVFDMRSGNTATAPVIQARESTSTETIAESYSDGGESTPALTARDHLLDMEVAELEDMAGELADYQAGMTKAELAEFLLAEHPAFTEA